MSRSGLPIPPRDVAALAALACLALGSAPGAASPGPDTTAPAPALPASQDRAFPGFMELSVDATDIDRRILRVHEHLTGVADEGVLLYPKWLPGTHAPEGPIDRLAGVRLSARGAPVPWWRDTVEPYALHWHAPAGTDSLDVDFTYLSPTSPRVGAMEISRDLLRLEWNVAVLYPGGYYARQVPVEASLTLPAGWQCATALEVDSMKGTTTRFRRTSLETLIDSPLLAGRYVARHELATDPVRVSLDLFADRPELLVVKPEVLAAHRALVQQAYKLFGSHHYAHYDFLYALSDQVQPYYGLEHQQSSDDGNDPDSLVDWDKAVDDRDLLAHEFTHSWNGKFRRPADLWTPDYQVPMQNSLLWVYEGQTQYWGQVLTARAGMWTRQQALDRLALTAAYYEHQAGRQWRPLQDTTNDEIINPRRPQSWNDWQRFEDYYSEGQLIWLDADTLIRERSGGQRSLDDFARAFFGVDDGSTVTHTYSFVDVVQALNAVEPYDWAAFLRERLDSAGRPAPLDGLRRGGYRLVYTDTPSEFDKAAEAQHKAVDLAYSLGLTVDDKNGTIDAVAWNSPAYQVRLTEGAQILAIDGIAYSGEVLRDAVRAARGKSTPIELIVKVGDRYRVVPLDYHEGLRYPHLERDPEQKAARLDDILAPRK